MDEFKTNKDATTKSDELSPNSPERIHAKDLMERAAHLLKPLGTEYLGSAVVHFYKGGLSYQLLTQLLCSEVPEQLAAQGGNQLFRDLMKVYGHEPPRRRN